METIQRGHHQRSRPWWKDTIIYQIYPRSFYDGDGDGIGDLRGIIQKLDYLKELGVETIWFSPFFRSPQKDFGYDISDYLSVAPEYGTMDTAEELIREAHSRGLKIVLDMVLNHTSDQHAWFLESSSGRDNPKADWYIWADGKGGGRIPPNNWQSAIGGSGWHYHRGRGQWYFSSFLPFQPDLNYHNPEVKKAMFDVVRFWIEKGADGFRLDIFNSIYKDKALRNNPWSYRIIPSEQDPRGFLQSPVHTRNHPGSFALARELRAVVDSYTDKERFTLGEVFGSHEVMRSYLGKEQDGLNLVFLFQTLQFKMKAPFFHDLIKEFEKEYPEPFLPVYVFSNHDRKRSISRIQGDHQKAKLLALIQLTVRGVPVIYQGEEIGMEQLFLPKKGARDPIARKLGFLPDFIRKILPENYNRDECRTPVQWTDAPNAGFCPPEVLPWLPVHPNFRQVNVAAAAANQNSLLSAYRELLKLRRSLPQLHKGGIQLDDPVPSDGNLLSYCRFLENEEKKIGVVLNMGSESRKLPGDLGGSLLFSTFPTADLDGGLPPWSGVILEM